MGLVPLTIQKKEKKGFSKFVKKFDEKITVFMGKTLAIATLLPAH